MSFLLYWHKLQCHPRVDMAMFANVKVLVVDGVAPEWIDNLHLTRGSLNILRVERSCMSNVPAFLYPVTSKEGCGIGGGPMAIYFMSLHSVLYFSIYWPLLLLA